MNKKIVVILLVFISIFVAGCGNKQVANGMVPNAAILLTNNKSFTY